MQNEVRSIPPAPRRARMQPLLAHRWPLLATSSALLLIGGVIAWAMFLQSGGKFSMGPRLDTGPTSTVDGTIKTVLDPIEFDGQQWNDVRYHFQWRGSRLYGSSFVPAHSLTVGDTVAIEVLDDDPNINRVDQGLLHSDRRWLHAQFWIVVVMVPGALILLSWLVAVFQLRQVLVHGDVSVARVLKIESVRYMLPEMLWVTYEFRDHRARMRKNRHWVRARGALGSRLRQHRQGGLDQALPVLHDRRLPQWNRLLLPQDFLLPAKTPRQDELPSD